MIISNPKNYDDKKPTNLRVRADLKAKMQEEIKKSDGKKSMADIVNEALDERYGSDVDE